MTSASLFVIHWNADEARTLAEPLLDHGCAVDLESEDGTAAVERITATRPTAVIIFLTRLPSHGRLVAAALKEHAVTRRIPLVFVGGKQWTIDQTRGEFPDAAFVGPEEICSAILPLIDCPESGAD